MHNWLARNAYLVALSAFAMAALMNVGVKLLGTDMPLLQILVARFAVGLIVLQPAMRAEGGIKHAWNISQRKGLLVSRAALGLLAVALSFYGFTHLPLAAATVLWKTGPMLVMLLAGPALGEPAGPKHFIAGLLGLAGTATMMQPGGGLAWAPVLIMLIGAVSAAISNLQVRELTKTESPTVIVAWYFALALIPCLLGLPWVAVVPTWPQALWLLWVGLAGSLMMMLNTTAYKLMPPATVAAYEYTTLIWATLFGWVIWHEWPTLKVWEGAALILAGSLLASTAKQKARA